MEVPARRKDEMPKSPSLSEVTSMIAEITSGASAEVVERVVRVLQEHRNSPIKVQARAVIGKDFHHNGRWIGITSSGTGVYVSLAGYVGVTVGWVEGFELNFFGAVLGFDIRRPALKLPGLGRFGVAAGL
jgi:hypothetical protein